MVDKGEKAYLKMKHGKSCGGTAAKGANANFGKLAFIGILVLVVLMACVLIQNAGMIEKINNVLAGAEVAVHDIYDDSAVIAAYKSGDSSKLGTDDTFVYTTLCSVIDEVITDDMTAYEKEKAIYDWQHAWVNFSQDSLNPIDDANDNNYTPYGVFKTHDAICVGNATTFKLFMDALDIPCVIIHSTENGEHAWDLVQIEGEWYHVDLTFDGGSGEPAYSYFNVPDSVKDDGSWPWDHNEIPAANGYEYCYMYMNAQELDDIYSVPEAVKAAIDNKDGMLAFTVKDKTDLSSGALDYIANQFYLEDGSVYFEQSYALGGKTVYKYSIYNWQDQDTGELDPEIVAKLDEKIQSLNMGEIPEDAHMEDFADYPEDNTVYKTGAAG